MSDRPSHIGKFAILRSLGEGAMGEVYLARDPLIGREVALKTIHATVLDTPDARERFNREAQAAGRLNHPNIVTIHEFGEDGGRLYLAMEYLPGDDLSALLRAGTLEPAETLELLAQVCDGLAYSHHRDILHRDIKPSNIRVTRISGSPVAKILDFGIAHIKGSELTRAGNLMGTMGYMAPETIQGQKAGPGADLFAVGVMLYEALAGVRPFSGESPATILHSIVYEEPAPLPSARIQGISPGIRDVLRRALEKDPAERYASAEVLAHGLRAAKNPAWAGETPTRTNAPWMTPETMPVAKAHGFRSARWVLAGAACLALFGIAGSWFGWRHLGRRTPLRTTQELPPLALLPAQRPAPLPASTPGQATQGSVLPAAQLLEGSPRTAQPEVGSSPSPAPLPGNSQTPKSGYRTINAAADGLNENPAGALAFMEAALQKDPENERALALRIVALYDLGRFRACAKAMEEARNAGHPPRRMALKYSRLAKMLQAEQRDQKLPKKGPQAR